MGALSLAVVKKEIETRNTGFIQQLVTYSDPQFRPERSPYYTPPPAHNRWGNGTWNFDSVDVPAAFAMYEQLKERVLNTGYRKSAPRWSS